MQPFKSLGPLKQMSLLGGAFCLMSLVSPARGEESLKADRADPLYRARGDHERSYVFPTTGETIAYRIYVPSTWKPGEKFPLLVVLHGGGLDQDAPFDRAPENLKGVLVAQAEAHHFIVAAPEGYAKAAMWGSPFGYGVGPKNRAPEPSVTPEEMAKINPRSEQDVLNVIELMRQEYGFDSSRIFLMGNSRGGMGTLYLAEKHPELWLAIAPSDGPIAEVDTYPYDRLKIKGAVFVHGSEDPVPIELNRAIANHIRDRGIQTEFDEVQGGQHGTSWYMALPDTMNFLDHVGRK